MECASGIIAQGINLTKVFEPIERIFSFPFQTCLHSGYTKNKYRMQIYKNKCLNRGKNY